MRVFTNRTGFSKPASLRQPRPANQSEPSNPSPTRKKSNERGALIRGSPTLISCRHSERSEESRVRLPETGIACPPVIPAHAGIRKAMPSTRACLESQRQFANRPCQVRVRVDRRLPALYRRCVYERGSRSVRSGNPPVTVRIRFACLSESISFGRRSPPPGIQPSPEIEAGPRRRVSCRGPALFSCSSL